MVNHLDQVYVQGSRPMTRRELLGNSARAAGVLALAGGTGGLLAACSSSTSPSAAASVTSVSFQQSWLLDVEFAGMYVAIQKGYFKKLGLDVTPVPGGVTIDPRTIVSSGHTLLGSVAEGTDSILGISNGADYKAIGAVYQKNPGCLMVHANSGITSVKGLVGKSIGLQNDARQQVLAILAYNHVSPNSVKLVTVGNDPAPFVSHQVDAYTAFAFDEPVALGLKGVQTNCFSFSDIGLPAYGDAIIAKRETIASQPDVLARFLKGLRQGWEFAIANTAEAAHISLTDYKLDEAAAQQNAQIKVEIPMLQSPATQANGLLWMEPNVWQQSINFMKNAKLITHPVTVDDVMTMEILNRSKSVS